MLQHRIDHLRALARQLTSQYLTLAETVFNEHQSQLWQRVRAPHGELYPSEEIFWEQELGFKRRTGFQLVAAGRVLAMLQLPNADREALSRVGLHKMDILVPVLSTQTSVDGARHWIATALELSRDELRDVVREALGRPRRISQDPVRRYVIEAMPDLDSRELATEFFAVGAAVVDSEKGLAILIAGLQEALSTWQAHTVQGELLPRPLPEEDHHGDPI